MGSPKPHRDLQEIRARGFATDDQENETWCVAFAGEDLRTLVITTASAELSDEDRQSHPDSGRLFSVRVDVPGLPVATWSGLSGPSSSAR